FRTVYEVFRKRRDSNARLEAGHGYVIYTDEIKEIRHGDYRSYTMYLQTPDTIKSNLYNFSIEEKGEETFLFVTKYRVANNWVEDSTLPFEGTISAYKVAIPNIEETSNLGAIELASWIDELEGLSGNGGSTTTTAYPYDCDGYVHTSIVVTEINCGCGHNWLEYMAGICIGSTCGLPIYPSKKTEYFYTCLPYPASGSPGSGTNPSIPGGDPSGGTGNGSGNPPAEISYGGNSITTPVMPEKDKNRNALKKMVSDGQFVAQSLDMLNGKTNETKEWGYAVKYPKINGVPTYTSNTVMQASFQNPNVLEMMNYIGGDYVGVFHTHPDPSQTTYVPMFSPEDVEYLFWVANKHNTNGQSKNYSVYVITLTVPSGTYALKIESIEKFNLFINSKYEEFKIKLRKAYDKSGNQASSSVLINNLLNKLKEYDTGITLYKANEDYSDWFKQIN